MKNLIIYILGVGHNTSVIAELAEDCGYEVAGLYHYNDELTGETDHGYKILGSFEDLFSKKDLSGMNFALSQGNNKVRAEVFEKIKLLGGHLPALIHPSAYVSKFAKIDDGAIISLNSIVQVDCHIGENSVVGDNAMIEHGTDIGKHCFIAFNSSIGAFIKIEDFAFIGIGAVLISSKAKTVGKNSVVGAGAVVTKLVEANTTVVGVPARNRNKNSVCVYGGGGV